jgi:hypothetical protein
MQLAKLMFRRKISTAKTICTVFFLLFLQTAFSQENSPYSRYGLGDIVPNTNVVNRGMAGISAGFADPLSVNYTNPASFSNFQTSPLPNGKVLSGRVVLDVGLNYDSRTLQAPDQPLKFSSSYGYFSYLQVGLPLTRKWGLSFGLRPLTRINYKINRVENLNDPLTGKEIDSTVTQFSGNGGSFLPTIGTGFTLGNLSLGGSIGYLFGKKEISTKRAFIDTGTSYSSSNYTNNASFGGVFFNVGAQYKIVIDSTKDNQTNLRLGISGNWKQNINASRDVVRETFFTDANGATQRIDSVYEKLEESGKIVYPASYTAGFVIEHTEKNSMKGWLIGVDYVTNQWKDYRFFNEADAVQTSSQIRIGGQIRPKPSSNYFSNVAYRAGFFFGKDYIKVDKELPQFGVTFGMGLPLGNYSTVSRTQFTIINLGFEYSKRGKNDNLLKENLFRISAGLNLSDLWFIKRRYD